MSTKQAEPVRQGCEQADKAGAPKIEIRHLSKTFLVKNKNGTAEPFAAISDFSFSIAASQFVAIVGPSGCGKSTFLDLAAGLTKPSSGSTASRTRAWLPPWIKSTRRSMSAPFHRRPRWRSCATSLSTRG